MKHIFTDRRVYGEEKRISNSKKHKAQKRNKVRVSRAVKHGEYQLIMKEIKNETLD